MKLWPTTNENKCFVKMLWHLLGECVKATVILVCSICTFFFQSSICAIFSYISINYIKSGYAATLPLFMQRFPLLIYSAILVSHFVFFLVLNSSYSTRRHCSYSSYKFFFFGIPFLLLFYFILYILLYWHNKFNNIFTIIEVSISYKLK